MIKFFLLALMLLVNFGTNEEISIIASAFSTSTARFSSSRARSTASLHAISFGSRPKQKSRKKQLVSGQPPVFQKHDKENRFDRIADTEQYIDAPCILTIRGIKYDMSKWARAHPGGPNILKRFHEKDCTKAFDAAGHSNSAYAMLDDFAIGSIEPQLSALQPSTIEVSASVTSCPAKDVAKIMRKAPRWRIKLFTHEDPIGIHKYMGIFSLLHFVFRYGQMIFGDPSAGLGTRLGKGPALIAAVTIIPHGILSASSLIFKTVPKERVVGKPMIWSEFRMHNIIFGLRSVATALLAWAAIYKPSTRRFAVILSASSVIIANAFADIATAKLRQNNVESTTATMPYWDGCSVDTQRRFKTFYAYCQFLATLACMACANPAWPLCVLLPIQLASLLMTLVRKGLISAKAYHIGYTVSLCLPFLVGFRDTIFSRSPDFPVVMGVGWVLYQLRRKGISKYLLWAPVVAFRIVCGDHFINWQVW